MRNSFYRYDSDFDLLEEESRSMCLVTTEKPFFFEEEARVSGIGVFIDRESQINIDLTTAIMINQEEIRLSHKYHEMLSKLVSIPEDKFHEEETSFFLMNELYSNLTSSNFKFVDYTLDQLTSEATKRSDRLLHGVLTIVNPWGGKLNYLKKFREKVRKEFVTHYGETEASEFLKGLI